MGVTTWNVKVPVVALVKAGSAADAVRVLEALLRAGGFDPYEGEPGSAFESEEED